MAERTLETDYLVVGCGASGMAFADALIAASDAHLVMVDRRHAPGGHWNDAYPFVRLHQPSLMYGVNSTPLGTDAVDRDGPNKGFYDRSSGTEIVAYYDRVMRDRLLASGRVRFFPMSDHAGGGRFVSRLTGDAYEVKVRRSVVDATYLEGKVPATTPPPFEVAAGARCVPVGDLVHLAGRAERYVIVGGGKTGIDACLWLLENNVAPSSIRWIRPREIWLLNRVYFQGGELVGTAYEGLSLQAEAAAKAESLDDLFARLAASEQVLRIDERAVPTMYRGATVSADELAQLRRIQPGFLPLSAAFTAYVEATRADAAGKNRLCPPVRLQNVPRDWAIGTLAATQTAYLWSQQPDVQQWLEGARLWWLRGLRRYFGEPRVQQAHKRYTENVRPATANLARLLRAAPF